MEATSAGFEPFVIDPDWAKGRDMALVRVRKLYSADAFRQRAVLNALDLAASKGTRARRTRVNRTPYALRTVEEAVGVVEARLASISRVRKGAVQVVEYAVAPTIAWFDQSSTEVLDLFYESFIDAIVARHGAEKVAIATTHFGDDPPTLRAYVVPITEHGDLSCTHFVNREAWMAWEAALERDVARELGLAVGGERFLATAPDDLSRRRSEVLKRRWHAQATVEQGDARASMPDALPMSPAADRRKDFLLRAIVGERLLAMGMEGEVDPDLIRRLLADISGDQSVHKFLADWNPAAGVSPVPLSVQVPMPAAANDAVASPLAPSAAAPVVVEAAPLTPVLDRPVYRGPEGPVRMLLRKLFRGGSVAVGS